MRNRSLRPAVKRSEHGADTECTPENAQVVKDFLLTAPRGQDIKRR